MTNALQVFSYGNKEVRTVIIDGEAWLVAKDVCDILEIQNVSDTVRKELDDDEKGIEKIYTPGGMQDMTVINEPGLYKLTFKSRKPAAKEFTRWVTHDVLPEIRRTGSYNVHEAEPLNVRVRVAEVLQRLALQVTSKDEREVINREAYKYATGQDLPKKDPAPKVVHSPRYWTARQIGATLKWPTDAVMHRAENLCITQKAENGYWDGKTWYFSKEGRKEFLELVGRGIVKIEGGYEYYENGYKHIHWNFDPCAVAMN